MKNVWTVGIITSLIASLILSIGSIIDNKINMNEESVLLQSFLNSIIPAFIIGFGYAYLKQRLDRQHYYINAIAFVLDHRTRRLSRENAGLWNEGPFIGDDDTEEKQRLFDMLANKFGKYLTVYEIREAMKICYAE